MRTSEPKCDRWREQVLGCGVSLTLTLTLTLTKLIGERGQVAKDAEALKRQAEGLSAEYARLVRAACL